MVEFTTRLGLLASTLLALIGALVIVGGLVGGFWQRSVEGLVVVVVGVVCVSRCRRRLRRLRVPAA